MCAQDGKLSSLLEWPCKWSSRLTRVTLWKLALMQGILLLYSLLFLLYE